MDVEWQDVFGSPVSERDSSVLDVVREEELSGFTFDGLKRRLGVHSETLSRILCRLEDQGIVEKKLDGYCLTSRAKRIALSHSFAKEDAHIPISQMTLPPNAQIQQIISSLRGRWFGMLRWLGHSENDDGITLKWVTEDGEVQINANFSGGQFSVEAKLLRGKDSNVALKAAYQLIGYVSGLCSRSAGLRRVACFTPFDQPYFSFA